MKAYFTLFFLLYTSLFFSQKITGVVVNALTNEPIEKAHIFLPKETVYTDLNGKFTFNLKKRDTINITITHLKFQIKKLVYSRYTSETPFVIYLDEKSEQLDEVVINTDRNLKNQINYEKLEDLPRGAYAFASSLIEGKIHVFGGDISSAFEKNKEGLSEQVFFSNEAEIMRVLTRPKPISFDYYLGDYQIYDVASKKWYYKKDKLLKRAYHNSVVYKDDVYLIGGKSFSKKKYKELLRKQVEVMSLKDSMIALDQSNPHQAVNFGSSIYQDKVLVFGGSTAVKENGNKVYSDEVHFYDIKTGNWYLLTKMLKAKEVKGIVFKNTLYLIGGYAKKSLTEITSFNLLTGKWKKEGDLSKSMRNPSLTKDDEFIYIQEGSRILTFKPKTKILKEYNLDIPLQNASLHYYNENLYLLGGFFLESYRKQASSSFFKISVLEFLTTKPIRRVRF